MSFSEHLKKISQPIWDAQFTRDMAWKEERWPI